MDLAALLGDQAADLLSYEPKINKEQLSLPGPDFIDRVLSSSDRHPQVLRNLPEQKNTRGDAQAG